MPHILYYLGLLSMLRISLISVIFLFSLINLAFAGNSDATQARIIYDPATLNINRIIHVDHDSDLAPHMPVGNDIRYTNFRL